MLSLQTRVVVQHGRIPMLSVSLFSIKTKQFVFCQDKAFRKILSGHFRQLAICTDRECKIVVNSWTVNVIHNGQINPDVLFSF